MVLTENINSTTKGAYLSQKAHMADQKMMKIIAPAMWVNDNS
jgi:hypothetical protein